MSKRMTPTTRKQWLAEKQRNIKRDAPAQRELDFSAIQTTITDEVFERLFLNLFLEICELVQDGFGDPVVTGRGSLWVQKYSAAFYNLVRTVARPGSDESQWDTLLSDGSQRCALLQGVVLKALEKNVFAKLLFGATPEHNKLLSTEDETLINVEGFKRTHLRAETNKVYLQSSRNRIPPHFWDEVDRVSAQIMRMLLPLYATFGNYTEPGTRDQLSTYQSLHDIVAHAAWLSVAFSLSPKIVRFDWVKPGELYRFEHVSVGTEVDEEGHRNNRGEPRRQRIMICAAPKVIIHSRSTRGGKTRYTIMKPRVVCYFGRRKDEDDKMTLISLDQHIRAARSSSRGFFKSFFWCMVTALLILAILYWAWEVRMGSARGFLARRLGKWSVMRSRASGFNMMRKFA
ncbi:hypothetical protein PT974_05955 [Cladobotryum mycophilum]|uniref:Uncharacterized protein n=1 Tax=Cladobotryum mycophilum TaxID=491253 RepID=A0ABR0SK58_9HYPO